jgi:hypothetical protein
MNPSTAALPHKHVVSVKVPAKKQWVFDGEERSLPPIDELVRHDGAYSPEVAYVCATISAWAYSDAETLATKLQYYGLEGAHVRQITLVNNALLVVATGYLVLSKTGKVGVLAFRGTDPASFVTWLTDAQVQQRAFLGGHVHAGFYGGLKAIWEDVAQAVSLAREGQFLDGVMRDNRPKLVKLKSPLKTLYVTGHSLGGAMAVLAAARLLKGDMGDWPTQVLRGVYTFGQPMVGDAAFSAQVGEAFGDRLFRHVYRDDVVPHLPPRSDFEYQHAGNELRAKDPNDAWTTSREGSERANAASAVISAAATAFEERMFPNTRIGKYSIDDHMPGNYVDASRNFGENAAVIQGPRDRGLMRIVTSNVTSAVDAASRGAIAARGVLRVDGGSAGLRGSLTRWSRFLGVGS